MEDTNQRTNLEKRLRAVLKPPSANRDYYAEIENYVVWYVGGRDAHAFNKAVREEINKRFAEIHGAKGLTL